MNLGFSEMAFIFILALIIFGPKKLPEIGRQIGKALAEFKRASNEFKWQLEAEMRQIEAEATRERLIKESKTTEPSPSILPPENGEAKITTAAAEVYPTTLGLEFRPGATAMESSSSGELIDAPDPAPAKAQGHDA
jgi:sec-independent protein translocase protein TatB